MIVIYSPILSANATPEEFKNNEEKGSTIKYLQVSRLIEKDTNKIFNN